MDITRRAGRDQELFRALSENLDGNFERLIRVFQDRLFSFSLRLTNNRADAEEIVQEGFVRAYRALKAYAPQRIELTDLSPWLYRIVLNVFRTRFRKGHFRRFSSGEPNPAFGRGEGIAEGADPEEMAGSAEIRKQLDQAIASLPERYRMPLVLRYVENIGYSQMSGILKQPEGTLKANVHRGIQILKSKFAGLKRRERS